MHPMISPEDSVLLLTFFYALRQASQIDGHISRRRGAGREAGQTHGFNKMCAKAAAGVVPIDETFDRQIRELLKSLEHRHLGLCRASQRGESASTHHPAIPVVL